uniref:Zinc finger and BTB domain-containing protein 20-like n=1 Tax=Saccoglossus kowalevskii TaxID=10224 RepID=A0ABM0MV31_SACKO|nr:PREDICTED: zinc finger and BTB domain-containing protein 20-like [Saccoglossus kowalevskii]
MLFSHVNTGRESLRAMTTKTLDFGVDTNGREYVTIPSRLNKKDEYNDKVVLYAAPGFVKCPIRSFKKYMAKLNPDSELFWQRPKRVTFEITEECPVWYQDAPVGHNSLRTYIATLSSEADLSQGYTNQSVRLAAASLKEGKVTDSLASEVLSIIAPKQVQSVATQNNNGMVTLVLCNPGNQPGQVFTSNNAVRQSSSTQPSFMIQRPPQTTYHQAGNTRQLTALPNAPQFSTQSISHSLQQSEKYMPQQHVMSSSLQQNTASNQASMSSNGQQMIPTSIHPMVPQVKNTSRPTHGAIPSFSASFLPQATSIPPPSVSQQLNASNASQSDNASVSTTTRASQQKSNTVCTWVVNPHSNAVLPMNSKDKQPGTQPVLLNHQTQTEKVIMTNKGIQADLAAENHTARGNAHVSDTNLYKCDACGISFNNAMVHAMHQSLHAKEEPFQCSMCRKSFSNTVEFNGHIFSSHQ